MLTILILLAILASIGVGYWLNVNTGLLAIVFAYLLSVCIPGTSLNDLVSLWPTKLFLIIFGVTFFFGFAIANGTLEQIAIRVVYATRNRPAAIPFALYGLVMLISGVGPGHYAVFVFLSPLVMAVASKTGMSRLLGAVIVVCGGMATTFNSISLGGRVTQGIFEQMGFNTPTAELYTHQLLLDSLIVQTVIFVAAYLLLQGYKTRCLAADAPPPLDAVQRKTVVLVLVILGLVVIPSLLAVIFPGQGMLTTIRSAVDPTFISILGVVLALICKIGDERIALAKVPWSIIILLCGMGMLISVATRAGTIDALSQWLGLHVGNNSVVYATGICAGIMSFFSSTLGVVMPTLYPIVPGLAAQTGVGPTVLFSVITSCAIMTGFSPFSSAGAMALAGVQEDAERSRLFYQLFMVPLLGITVVFALAFLRVLG